MTIVMFLILVTTTTTTMMIPFPNFDLSRLFKPSSTNTASSSVGLRKWWWSSRKKEEAKMREVEVKESVWKEAKRGF